jgi:Transposase IS116/IS110/IS902 family
MTSWSWAGGRSRSPTRRRSRAWRHWRARPTGSTRGCWPSWPAATWSQRSGCRRRRFELSGSGPAGGCTWSVTGSRSRTGCMPRCWPSGGRVGPRTCSARAVERCWPAWGCPNRGRGPRPRRSRSSTTWTPRSAAASGSFAGSAPTSLCAAAHVSPWHRLGLGYTIAAELGDIGRFPSPKKLVGYTGLCPRVYQSGGRDHRGPLARNGPTYLRWALVEAAVHAAHHPGYRGHYQRTKTRLGAQRGPAVARVEVARKLTEVIWHMLTKQVPFAPARSQDPLVA